jgi:parvulin-like peptidyl-prolyl isomerase
VRARTAWFLLGGLAAAAAGCARPGVRAAARASVIALAGNRPVELAAFATYAQDAAGDELRNLSPRVASSLLDQYLEEILIERAVEDAVPKALGATPAERRRDLIARRARLEEVGDSDLRKEYDAHPDRYLRPEGIRVSQLFFTDRGKADAAVKRLAQGSTWEDVSREMSRAPNAATGGSLGLLTKTDVPRDFERALWGLKPGAMTPVLTATHGFHVFRVEERFNGKPISLAEAVPALRLAVAEERSAQGAEEILREARVRYPLAVLEDHLPFPYVGSSPKGAGAAP